MRVLLTILFILLANIVVYANRGDIISSEVISDWDTEEATEQYWNIINGFIPDDSRDSLKVVFTNMFHSMMVDKKIISYRIVYKTIDHYGNPTQASGLVIIPKKNDGNCKLPIFYYGHGTAFERYSIPSRPENWGSERFFVYLSAAMNFIGVAPDYYGLGDRPGFHHHNSAQTNSTSGIDMIRAARKLVTQEGGSYNEQVYVSGYSEGGHNAMAMIKMIHEQQLRSEFNIISAGCGSGAYDTYDLQYHYILDNPYYPTRSYILYIVGTCEDIYGNIINEDLGETYNTYLNSPYDTLYVQHLLGQDGNMGWVPLPWTSLFSPGVIDAVASNPEHPLRQCLKQSAVYDWANPYHTGLYYVRTDEQVYWKNAPKAKLAQWKYIPWYKFWDKARIATFDMTAGGAVDNHFIGAVPIMMHYLFSTNLSKNMSCSSPSEALMQTVVANYDKTIDLPLYKYNDIKEVMAINMSDFKAYPLHHTYNKSAQNSTVHLEDMANGAYILVLKSGLGDTKFLGLLNNEPEFLSSEEYNPISLSTSGTYLLDMTLLEDKVDKVLLYENNGRLIKTITEPYAVQELGTEESLQEKNCVIEIHGAIGRYYVYLLSESAKKSETYSIAPNPFYNTITVNTTSKINTISVYDIDGKTCYLPMNYEENKCEINTTILCSGVYMLEINDASGVHYEKAIKK